MNQTTQTEDQHRHAIADAAYTPATIRRQYVHSSAAWYAERNHYRASGVVNCADDITIVVTRGAELLGEFAIIWQNLNSIPHVRIHDDAFAAARECTDLIEAYQSRQLKKATPTQICDLLNELGFIDATPRECPFTADGEHPYA